MTTTPNLSIPLLVSNQSGKEVTHNEALITIDAILNSGITDMGISAPPENSSDGDSYVVGSNPTEEFANHENDLAFYNNGWRFIKPNEGLTIWVNDEDLLYTYNGTNWIKTAGQNSDYFSKLGIGTVADETNRLAVASDTVLFDKATNDSRVKVNKNVSANTASHLFQVNYSGRAEFGLIGNDNFTLKVSYNGSVWNDSFVVDKDTGNVGFKKDVNVDGSLNVGNNSEAGIAEVRNGNGITKAKMSADGDSFFNGGSVVVGGTTVDIKSILDLQSTDKGFLPPRMSTIQRDIINNPPIGLVIYNITVNKLQCYNGSLWNDCF